MREGPSAHIELHCGFCDWIKSEPSPNPRRKRHDLYCTYNRAHTLIGIRNAPVPCWCPLIERAGAEIRRSLARQYPNIPILEARQ